MPFGPLDPVMALLENALPHSWLGVARVVGLVYVTDKV